MNAKRIFTRKRPAATLLAGTLVFATTFLAMTALNRGSGDSTASAELSRAALSTDARVRATESAIRTRPRDARGYTELGELMLQKSRETGEPGYYERAENAFRTALRFDRRDFKALVGIGGAQLGRHEFEAGLKTALRARRVAPDATDAFPVIADAQIELGRYRAATRTLESWVAREPGLASYTRISYFRELHGDIPGALQAMRLAASSGARSPENLAFVKSLIGKLEAQRGRKDAALAAYREALFEVPGHAPATAGIANLEAGAGRYASAVDLYRKAARGGAQPAYKQLLAETLLAAGRRTEAEAIFERVGAEMRRSQADGYRVDAELALFEADFGDPRRAVAAGRRAWSYGPNVEHADAFGWALTKSGKPRQGLVYARRALAFGSVDPHFLYHAGIAARDAGNARAAIGYLRRALKTDKHFSPLFAPRAARALERLERSVRV